MEQSGKQLYGLNLISRCGGGAFGDVWYCQDASGKKLALKIISKIRLGDQWKKELKGVKNYRKITENHPELLQIFHVGEDGEYFYYTMEPADNVGTENYQPDTLAWRLQKGALSPEEYPEILAKIFQGIKVIHKEGFTHRDIKPDNILFVKGEPKLADIGLMSSMTVTVTQLAGTPCYIPPELLLGKSDYDKKSCQRSDFYAFGKVIYCTVTGFDPGNFPSSPKKWNSGIAGKYFYHLSMRLSNSDLSQRITEIDELSREMEKIAQVLQYGETFWGKIRFSLQKAGDHLKSSWSKRKPYYISCLLLLVIGGYWGYDHLKNKLKKDDVVEIKVDNQENKTGISENTEIKTDNSEKQVKKSDKAPDGMREFLFGGGRYSFFIPNQWTVSDRNAIDEYFKKNKNFSESQNNIRIRRSRNVWAVFHLKDEKGKSLNAWTELSIESFTSTQIDALSDQEMAAHFGKNLRGVKIRRHKHFRQLESLIFLFGRTDKGEECEVYLLPRKNHCIKLILTKGPEASEVYLFQLLETFREKNVAVQKQNGDSRTPLMLALWDRNFTLADKLLKDGADINETAYSGSTALHLAAEENQTDAVKFLLNRNADPNIQDSGLETPLHFAAKNGNAEILSALLEKKGNPDVQDTLKYTPLCYAVKNSHVYCAELLLRAKARWDIPRNEHFGTPILLHIIIAKNSPELERLLIRYGVPKKTFDLVKEKLKPFLPKK